MKLLSIAFLTFRSAVRSRTALSLAVLILLSVLAIPSFLDSDMEASQSVSLALFYTLSAVEVFLCIAAVWIGAASFSQDIRKKTIHLLLVKPVALWQVWAGKWLGLVSLFGLLLLLGFGAMYARVRFFCGGGLPPGTEVSSRLVQPVLPDPREQAEFFISAAKDENGEPLKGKELAEYRREIEMRIPFLTDSIVPGEKWEWTFNLQEKVEGGKGLSFRFKFDSGAVSREGIGARCTVSSPGIAERVTFDLTDFSSRELVVPFSAAPFEGAERIDLEILHSGEKGAGAIIMQPRQGIHLLQPAASFAMNMLRSFFVVFTVVSLVTALGLTLGAVFTLPVAVFSAVALIVTVLIANSTILGQSVSHDHITIEESFIDGVKMKLGDMITDSVVALSAPVYRLSPLSRLSSFEYVGNTEVRDALLCNLLAMPAFFSLFSAFCLRRRELCE